MTCYCRTGARCLPCIDRDGLTRPKATLHLRVTLPHFPNILKRAVAAMGKPS